MARDVDLIRREYLALPRTSGCNAKRNDHRYKRGGFGRVKNGVLEDFLARHGITRRMLQRIVHDLQPWNGGKRPEW